MKLKRMDILGIVLVAIFTSSIALAVTLPAKAQVDPNDRFFEKDFCATEQTLLDDIIYDNGQEISYDSSGCPISTKVIHRWNEISQARQTIISSRLATNGYEDVTNEVNQVLRGNGN